MPLLSHVKTEVLNLLFPPLCFKCNIEGSFLCAACKETLAFAPPQCFVCKKWSLGSIHTPRGRTCASCQKKTHIYTYYSPFSYHEEPIHALIHRLKYRSARILANTLTQLLVTYHQKFSLILPPDSVIIPIPLYKSRERTRGFNQARLIADTLGEALYIPVMNDVLYKTKKTKSQTDLSREERLQNVVGAFRIANRECIKNKNIILVDDVKTTGATLETAACILDAAGAKKIWAITIAH